ncbi:MAG: protein kinase [Salinibacter sp.]
MPDVGDILDGYRLDAVVGRGGMGTVYRATDVALEATVAVKVIAPHLADDDTFVRRFYEEAKALARLDAPGIVDVYALREAEEALFFVMEYVEGSSLQAVLQRDGTLSPEAVLSLLRQVLDAVGHAHASGVLHRDLKPSNILLDADGRAVITDFGLAKILASDAEITATHDRLGTVAYMSPEQIEGLSNVEEASDLFSVGLLAYEALTGRLPFDTSASDYVIQRAIVEESFPPPSAYVPEIPPSLERVVMDLLAKAPADRPPSAEAALDRLPASDGTEAVALPEASTAASSTLSASRWVGVGLATVLVLLGTVVGVRLALDLPPFALSGPALPDSTVQAARTPSPRGGGAPQGGGPPSDSIDGPRSQSTADTARLETRPASPPAGSSATAQAAPPSSAARAKTAAPSPTRDPAPQEETAPREEEAASPRPPASAAQLTVRSEPSGAAVRLGDSLVGDAPVTVGDLNPGSYRIALGMDDRRPAERTVGLSAGDTVSVRAELAPRPAVVTLRAVPSGDVIIDGERRAENTSRPVTDSLPPGAHQVALVSDLGRWETDLQLEAGERYEETVDFTQRVEVAITARATSGAPVPNAVVTVDGEQVGYTPQRLTLRVGQHTVRVTKDGYAATERTLLVAPDMDTPIEFVLSPSSG